MKPDGKREGLSGIGKGRGPFYLDDFRWSADERPPEESNGILPEEPKRKRGRSSKKIEGLFVPPIRLAEVQEVAGRLSTARAFGLWLAIHAQSRMEGKEWVRVRSRFLARGGLGEKSGRSRAYAELLKAGLIEVQRRPGHVPKVRLLPVSAAEYGEDEDDE
jgi:hypothetical protein